MISTIEEEYDELFGKRRRRKSKKRKVRQLPTRISRRPSAIRRGNFPGYRKRSQTKKSSYTIKPTQYSASRKASGTKIVTTPRRQPIPKEKLIVPFPPGAAASSPATPSVVKQPVVIKTPKTVAPIRPMQPKESVPKQTGPLSKITKANPGLKPTLVKGNNTKKRKPEVVADKKKATTKQPKHKQFDDTDRPINPGNDSEPDTKPENRPSKGNKALKVAGWVAGTILVAGLIRHYLILPNIKDQYNHATGPYKRNRGN